MMQHNPCRLKNAAWLLALLLVQPPQTVNAQSMPALPESQFILPATTCTIPLQWKGDTINGKWEPHVALLVPVQLPHCPLTFFMQFDTGSPFSLLYKNKLRAIGLRYPGSIAADSSNQLFDFGFRAGNTTLLAKEIALKQLDSSGINWKDKKNGIIIGTIGTDLLDKKVAIIDYPALQLVLADTLPEGIQPGQLSQFMYAARSILLPAQIKGTSTVLYFDSGSSMYELLASKTTCEQLAIANGAVITSKVRSWGRMLTANSLASNDSISISNKKIPVRYATYVEGASDAQVARMLQMGIGGLTGNKLFLKYRLVLDTKHKRFGLLEAVKENKYKR